MGQAGPSRRGRPRGGEAGGAARQGRPRHPHGPRVPGAAGRDGRDLPRGRGRAGEWPRPCAGTTTRSRSSPRRSPPRPSPARTGSRACSPPSPSPTSSTPWPGTSAWARARPAAATPTACAAPARARCAPCSTSGGRRPASRPDLQALLAAAVAGHGELKQPADKTVGGRGAFLLDRLAYVLQARGFSADEVGAVIAAPFADEPPASRWAAHPGAADPIDACAASRRSSACGARPGGLRRPGRGLQARQEHPRAAGRRGGGRSGAVRGRRRARALRRRLVASRAAAGSYEDRLRGLASLRAPVGRFFDDVLVMAEDARVRGQPARPSQISPSLSSTASRTFPVSEVHS